MIATNEAADVLRHGWLEAAQLLAADVPEVADVLVERLETAIAAQRLDEPNLLATIEEVESITSRAGSRSGQALARRMRRTVYEYLLALDAVRPGEAGPATEVVAEAAPTPTLVAPVVATPPEPPVDAPPVTSGTAEESASAAPVFDEAGTDQPATDVDEGIVAEGHGARRRIGLRRREPADDVTPAEADLIDGLDAGAALSDQWPATSPIEVEPIDPGMTGPGNQPATEGHADAAPDVSEEVPGDPTGDVASDTGGFVAPRAGFHIVGDDDLLVERAPAPAAEVESAEVPPPARAIPQAPAGEFVAWTGPPAEVSAAGAGEPETGATTVPVAAGSPLFESLTAGAPATAPAVDESDDDEDDAAGRGWRVRDSRQVHRKRATPAATAAAPREADDDPFGTNPKLAETRRRIEDRLRRKRSDEAAALLQQLAQDVGGRAVAELAMNAGDRCRALGKSNAALNCYLAASRADPVYELPLARLADVCIDSQDTDLAVSYLERIARLYRYRGDDRNALRVYRRIATIAPYREDVLALLLTAQTTGRLD